MSRSLEYIAATRNVNGNEDVLTVPAGHKYEVVWISAYPSGAVDHKIFLYRRLTDNSLQPIAQFATTVAIRTGYITLPGVVFYEGEKVNLYDQPASGGGTFRLEVHYVDVDYTD